MTIIDVTGKLVINPKTREWCKMRYLSYKKGCPMYGKRPSCPPQAPMVQDFIDLEQPHIFIYVTFDLMKHALDMLIKHPTWSKRQCRNCRYWQNGVTSQLQKEVRIYINKGALLNSERMVYTVRPEAMGVNVLQTARNVGIPIETKPTKTVYKIALVGFPRPTPNLVKEA